MLLLSSNCFSRPSWEQKFLFVFFLFAMRQVTMFCWTLVIWAFVCNETHRLCRCQQKKPTKDPVNKRCFSPLFPVFWERRKGNTFWLIDYVHVHSFFAESTFHLVFFQKRVVEIRKVTTIEGKLTAEWRTSYTAPSVQVNTPLPCFKPPTYSPWYDAPLLQTNVPRPCFLSAA